MGAAIIRLAETDAVRYVEEAAALVRGGGIAVLPTETVYGAAALLSSALALDRLRNLPPATGGKPLVIHLADPEHAFEYLGDVTDFGRRVINKLWPGPVGLVFDVPADRQQKVAQRLGVDVSEIYDGGSITLRCPDHPVAQAVLENAGGPVVLRRGGHDAQRADGAIQDWGDLVEIILNAGPTRFSKPSTIVKVHANRCEIVRVGVYDQRIIDRMLQTTILFVCSGNTCRSPMAEALARSIIAEKLNVPPDQLESKGVNVVSAGSFAMPGARATPAAVDAVQPLGGDLSNHRSKPLSVELIHQADLIYTMGRSHAQAVTALVPSAAQKVQTLNPAGDIEDPIGGDAAVYQSLAGQLKDLIQKRLEERPLP